jgi:hypothetical protein
MKHLFSSALLALMTFPVLANFVGLEYDVVAESEFGTTYRVYAKFDNTTDEVVAVYALETAPMNVAVSTTFYQAPVGGAFAQGINPLFFSAFPELQYDSWFTIGSADSNGTSDVQQVGMRTSIRLKMVAVSTSTPSSEALGLCFPTKVQMLKPMRTDACWSPS